jgi:hypothetical protein
MAKTSKTTVQRLPPVNDPRRQLPFRFRSYRELTNGSGRYDALAASLSLSVQYFLKAAEEFAEVKKLKALEIDPNRAADPRDKRDAMWEFGNDQAKRFSINTANTHFGELPPHTTQLLLVSAYQQAETFLNGVRSELRNMGIEWPTRGDHEPLLKYTLENLPNGLKDNKTLIGEERYDLFEYYRLMRNAFVHGPISKAKLTEQFATVEPCRELVASEYKLDAPNSFEKLKLDDYMLFTRLIKYIATDICRIGEPSDQALVKLIEWKEGKVEKPLQNFLKFRPSRKRIGDDISKWFKENYSMTLARRPNALDALVTYVDQFPNKRTRRKAGKVSVEPRDQGTKKPRRKR